LFEGNAIVEDLFAQRKEMFCLEWLILFEVWFPRHNSKRFLF